MFGLDDAIAAGLKIIDKFVPDPEAKAKAEQELRNTQKDLVIANLEADKIAMQETSKRWVSDMASDSWMSKNIRPMTLIALLGAYFFFAFMSMLGYETRGAYVELLGQWGQLVMLAYFSSRGIEKVMDMRYTSKDERK